MDRPLPVVLADGDLRWSDSHSMDSDDNDVRSAGLRSPWLGAPSTSSTSVSLSSSAVGFAHTGQLSPISNGVGLPLGVGSRSSASLASPSRSPPVRTESLSTPSSVPPQPWAPGYPHPQHVLTVAQGPENHAPHRQDVAWDRSREDTLMALKPEPLDDDDFCMDAVREAPGSPPTLPLSSLLRGTEDHLKQKRPRGRPRKHPLVPHLITNKITKGRSKTGCLTCRKRKKKCDEAKPRCMNCEKNAVVCEGYPEKQIWKSGKERAEEERLKIRTFPSITIPPLFHGLETLEDRIFWKHYNEHLSTVLTVEGEHKNAFKDMIVPIAVQHQGLMHSILSLASKHLDFGTPYGINVLRNNPNTTLEALRERSLYHHDQARRKFYDDVECTNGKQITSDKTLAAARYAQMLCFLLEALVEGTPRGEHRIHLTVYRNLVTTSPPEESAFMSFIAEIFHYHIFVDELIHSALNQDASSVEKPLPVIPAIHPPRLLGVTDGLLGYMSKITAIRNKIRNKMLAQMDPAVDYEDLYPASDIDGIIKDWNLPWPPGDGRYRVSLLYQQMMSIYINMTVFPPSSSAPSSMASSAASLSFIHSSPTHGRPLPSVVNTPPQSASTSCASSPRFTGSGHAPKSETSRPISRLDPPSSSSRAHGGGSSNPHAADAGTAGGNRGDSPPPIRQPPRLKPEITIAVEQSLALFESFKPNDPCQTLLLLPCFLVGIACFSPTQQRRVRAAIRIVRGYTGLRNADSTLQVLEEVWRLMAAGDWVAAWDWPGVAQRLGVDFIPA